LSTHVNRATGEDDLQRELRDLLSLAVVGDHLRWVLRGDDSTELTDWLDGAIAKWRAWADQVAKQLAASGIAPDARVRSLAKDVPLNWVPDGWLEADEGRQLVSERLATVARWACYRHSQATGSRAEILDLICTGLRAQLQQRSTEQLRRIAPQTHLAKEENPPTTAP
jgi:DNA-binding ferritin-like protein